MGNKRPVNDFHIHSYYSGENGHAEGTLEEIVEAARARGYEEILITDHGPGHYGYGTKRSRFAEIREEINRLNRKYEDIKILMGLEANIVSSKGHIDLAEEDKFYFDRINVGYHYGILPKDFKFFISFMVLNPLSKVLPFLKNISIRMNTDAMIRLVQANDIFTVTHPGSKVELDIERLARACAKEGTALEINSSGHGKLSVEDIGLALKTDVKFTLGSDAHRLKRVGDLESSMERLRRAGIPEDRVINKFI